MHRRTTSWSTRLRATLVAAVVATLGIAACSSPTDIPGVGPDDTTPSVTLATGATTSAPDDAGATASDPGRPEQPAPPAGHGRTEIPGVVPAPTQSDGPALTDALTTERAALRQLGTDAAADKLAQLDQLPADTDAALAALAGYTWTSPAAQQEYQQVVDAASAGG